MNTERNAQEILHDVLSAAETAYRANMRRIRTDHRGAVLRLAIHNEIYRMHNQSKRAAVRLLEDDIVRLEARYEQRFGRPEGEKAA